MTSSGSFQCISKRKMSFHAFGQCFQLFLDTALQKPENGGGDRSKVGGRIGLGRGKSRKWKVEVENGR